MKLLLCTTFCLSLLSSMHTGHIAEYQYDLNGKDLNLSFMIEKEELLAYAFSSACDFENMTALCLSLYLKEKNHLYLNGKRIDFDLEDSFSQGGYLFVRFTAPWSGVEIRNISIETNGFYEFDIDFKNRLVIHRGSYAQSYLLDKTSRSLKLQLN